MIYFHMYQRIRVGKRLGRIFPDRRGWLQRFNNVDPVRVYFDDTKGRLNRKHSIPTSLVNPNTIETIDIEWEKIKTQFGGQKENHGKQTCRVCRQTFDEGENCWYAKEEAIGFRTVCTNQDCELTIGKDFRPTSQAVIKHRKKIEKSLGHWKI